MHFQRLLCCGKQLDDDAVLFACGIMKESTLHIVGRLLGGVQSLDELADAIASARRHELPNGKCLVCTAKCKRERWCDHYHFGTKAHASAMEWAQRQVDNGQLNSSQHTCTASASSSSCDRSNAHMSEHVLYSGSRTAWFKILRPENCDCNAPVDGVFLVDSFHYFKSRNGKTY